MKKIVLKLHIHDDKDKRKIMKSVSRIVGIDSLAVDMKEKKLTVIGDIDPCQVVCKLRKHCPNLLTVGPAKEEKKGGKDGDGKNNRDGDNKPKITHPCSEYCTPNCPCHWHYYPYYPHPACYRIYEENPSVCVIS